MDCDWTSEKEGNVGFRCQWAVNQLNASTAINTLRYLRPSRKALPMGVSTLKRAGAKTQLLGRRCDLAWMRVSPVGGGGSLVSRRISCFQPVLISESIYANLTFEMRGCWATVVVEDPAKFSYQEVHPSKTDQKFLG
jgi:hypothetical protein